MNLFIYFLTVVTKPVSRNIDQVNYAFKMFLTFDIIILYYPSFPFSLWNLISTPGKLFQSLFQISHRVRTLVVEISTPFPYNNMLFRKYMCSIQFQWFIIPKYKVIHWRNIKRLISHNRLGKTCHSNSQQSVRDY